jgi:hypothetical protein
VAPLPDVDVLLRAVLAGESLVAMLLAGHLLGSLWHERGWPVRVILVGALGVLAYVLAGQVKAYNLGIPFDAFSWIGLTAYAVLLSGLVWHFVHEQRRAARRNRRGR